MLVRFNDNRNFSEILNANTQIDLSIHISIRNSPHHLKKAQWIKVVSKYNQG